jgi:hypothetical protein
MDRLTKRIGEHVYYTKGKYEETIPAECESWDVRTILQRLAEYEDTGLTPEEIAEHEEMFKAYRHVCGGKSPEEIAVMITKNADLRTDLQTARECNQDMLSKSSKLFEVINNLRAELEQVKAEREAAVADLKIHGGCSTCKHKVDTPIVACKRFKMSVKLRDVCCLSYEWHGKDGANGL